MSGHVHFACDAEEGDGPCPHPAILRIGTAIFEEGELYEWDGGEVPDMTPDRDYCAAHASTLRVLMESTKQPDGRMMWTPIWVVD